jgi:hypothetical protein
MIIWLLASLYMLGISSSMYAQEMFSNQQLADLINEQRVLHHVAPITAIDSAANQMVDSFAQFLAMQSQLVHQDAQGRRSLQRYRACGGTGLAGAEILASGSDVSQMILQWLNSPSHRQALLDPQWTAWGLTLLPSGYGYIAVVYFTNSLSQSWYYTWQDSVFMVHFIMRQMHQVLRIQIGQAIYMLSPGQLKYEIMIKSAGPEIVTIFNDKNQGDQYELPYIKTTTSWSSKQ